MRSLLNAPTSPSGIFVPEAARPSVAEGDIPLPPGFDSASSIIGSVTLENDVSVWFNVVIRADNDQVTIGEASNVQDGSVLHVLPSVAGG